MSLPNIFSTLNRYVSSFSLSLKFSCDECLLTKAEMRYLLVEIEYESPVVMQVTAPSAQEFCTPLSTCRVEGKYSFL